MNKLFRNRIGFPEHEKLTIENLSRVLEKAAFSIPFENLCVLGEPARDINRRNLQDKILLRKEGGLCYELNALLYYFLVDNGFDVTLVRGVVYDDVAQQWGQTGRTHVTILLRHEGADWLVDTGFGGNLPLRPVPLSGETVSSANGEFRVRRENTGHGSLVLDIRIRHKDTQWRAGYTFDPAQAVEDISELNEVQAIIRDHPDSPFNTSPLVVRLTDRGNVTLTDTSFTRWEDGEMTKEKIDADRFQELAGEYLKTQP